MGTILRHFRRQLGPFLLGIGLTCACNGPAPASTPTKAPTPAAQATTTTGAPTPAEATAPASPAPTELKLVKGSREMMGTIVMITVAGKHESIAVPAIDAALSEMERLERVLSEWDPSSEISHINAGAGHAVKVGPETLAVVKAGLEVSRWSDGAYDLSWAALRDSYKFQPGQQHAPDLNAIRTKLPLVDYRDIVVDDAASTVMLKRAGMQIGTGSIAKGYALDRATAVLVERGMTSFMIFGGGQVQVHGLKGQRPWRVGIQHPRKDDYFGFVEAVDVSISTSGDYEHSFMADGRRWHHIIDLKTGLPVDHTTSVTVVCESGLYADALSTAVFVLGAERALAKLDTAPGRPEVVIVDRDMGLHISPGMRGKLILHAPLDGNRLP